MNLSIGEYRALVAKAFRGAGYPWGLTEDGSFAAACLARFGLDDGSAVVRLLETVDGRAVLELMPRLDDGSALGPACPVCAGAAVSDAGFGAAGHTMALAEPMLALPLAARRAAADQKAAVVSWPDGECAMSDNAVQLVGVGPTEALVHITAAELRLEPSAVLDRVDLVPTVAAALERFAQRTYAPATETSRLSGAGAGLIDDD